MKNRFLILLFCLVAATSFVACSSSKSEASANTSIETAANEDDNQNNEAQEKTGASRQSANAVSTTTSSDIIAYEALEIKTDWTEAASITISGDNVTIDGSGASYSDGVITITDGGAYTISGTSDDIQILVNSEKNVKLILNGVNLSNDDGPVIYGQEVKNLYIELASDTTNTIEDGSDYAIDSSTGKAIGKAAIFCEDDLIIIGDGTLNVTGNYKHALASDDDLYIESGIINITSNVKKGIHTNDRFVMDGGTVTIESVDEGIESENSIYINGGTLTVNADDDGINSQVYMEINGGTITVYSEYNDALDSNGGFEGCITINGGTLDLTSAESPEEAIDTDWNGEIINGGDITTHTNGNSSMEQGPGMGGQGGFGGGRSQMQGGQMPDDFDGELPEQGQGFGGRGGRGGFDNQSNSSDTSL